MEDINQKVLDKLDKIQLDIEFIRESLGEDEELTDWAKEELEEARNEPADNYVSLEEMKKKILSK